MTKTSTNTTQTGWFIFFFSVVGFTASTLLLREEIRAQSDSSYTPICSVNEVIDCGTVMNSWQSEVFGFPSVYLGVIGFFFFSIISLLYALGYKLHKYVWALMQAGVVFAVIFTAWMMWVAIMDIKTLCIFCMVVWACVIPLNTLVYSITVRDYLDLDSIGNAVSKYWFAETLVEYLIVAALIAHFVLDISSLWFLAAIFLIGVLSGWGWLRKILKENGMSSA